MRLTSIRTNWPHRGVVCAPHRPDVLPGRPVCGRCRAASPKWSAAARPGTSRW